jgi:hypothetical protein
MLPNTHRGSRARRRYRSGAHRPLPVAAPPFDSIATAPPARNGESRENAGDVRMPEERSVEQAVCAVFWAPSKGMQRSMLASGTRYSLN